MDGDTEAGHGESGGGVCWLTVGQDPAALEDGLRRKSHTAQLATLIPRPRVDAQIHESAATRQLRQFHHPQMLAAPRVSPRAHPPAVPGTPARSGQDVTWPKPLGCRRASHWGSDPASPPSKAGRKVSAQGGRWPQAEDCALGKALTGAITRWSLPGAHRGHPRPAGRLPAARQPIHHARRPQQRTKGDLHVGAAACVLGNEAVRVRGGTRAPEALVHGPG